MFPPGDDSPDNVLTSPAGTKTVRNFANDSMFQQHLVTVSQGPTSKHQTSHIPIVLLREAHKPLGNLWYVVPFSYSVWSHPPLVIRWRHVYQHTQRSTSNKPENQWGSKNLSSDPYLKVVQSHKQGWKWFNGCHHLLFIELFLCSRSWITHWNSEMS